MIIKPSEWQWTKSEYAEANTIIFTTTIASSRSIRAAGCFLCCWPLPASLAQIHCPTWPMITTPWKGMINILMMMMMALMVITTMMTVMMVMIKSGKIYTQGCTQGGLFNLLWFDHNTIKTKTTTKKTTTTKQTTTKKMITKKMTTKKTTTRKTTTKKTTTKKTTTKKTTTKKTTIKTRTTTRKTTTTKTTTTKITSCHEPFYKTWSCFNRYFWWWLQGFQWDRAGRPNDPAGSNQVQKRSFYKYKMSCPALQYIVNIQIQIQSMCQSKSGLVRFTDKVFASVSFLVI